MERGGRRFALPRGAQPVGAREKERRRERERELTAQCRASVCVRRPTTTAAPTLRSETCQGVTAQAHCKYRRNIHCSETSISFHSFLIFNVMLPRITSARPLIYNLSASFFFFLLVGLIAIRTPPPRGQLSHSRRPRLLLIIIYLFIPSSSFIHRLAALRRLSHSL